MNIKLNNEQLELSIRTKTKNCHLTRRSRTKAVAARWFQRMRQIVDRAADWPPAQPATQTLLLSE